MISTCSLKLCTMVYESWLHHSPVWNILCYVGMKGSRALTDYSITGLAIRLRHMISTFWFRIHLLAKFSQGLYTWFCMCSTYTVWGWCVDDGGVLDMVLYIISAFFPFIFPFIFLFLFLLVSHVITHSHGLSYITISLLLSSSAVFHNAEVCLRFLPLTYIAHLYLV